MIVLKFIQRHGQCNVGESHGYENEERARELVRRKIAVIDDTPAPKSAPERIGGPVPAQLLARLAAEGKTPAPTPAPAPSSARASVSSSAPRAPSAPKNQNAPRASTSAPAPTPASAGTSAPTNTNPRG